MKNLTRYLLLMGLSMAFLLNQAQSFPVTVLPSTQCAVSQGNSATGMVGFVMPGASSFSWSASGTGTCMPLLVALPPSGSMVTISYPCCGVFSITCTAFDAIGMPMGNSTVSSTVVCQPTLNVSVAPTGTLCSGATATLSATGAGNYTWLPGNSNGASTNVTPTASGCYTLVGEVSTCTSQAVKCLTVQGGAASLSVTPSSPSVCAGSSIGLTASGATSYSWNTGATTSSVQLTPSTSTTYTVIGDPGNCQSTKTVSVTVQSVPVLSLTSSAPSLCKGKTATLTASGASTYAWPGSTLTLPNIVVTPTLTTTYSVTGTASNNCSAKASITQSVVICTGLEESGPEQNLVQLFPNPTKGFLTLKLNSSDAPVGIEIFDLSGRLLLKQTLNGSATSFDLREYAAGFYYLHVKQGQRESTLKVLKE